MREVKVTIRRKRAHGVADDFSTARQNAGQIQTRPQEIAEAMLQPSTSRVSIVRAGGSRRGCGRRRQNAEAGRGAGCAVVRRRRDEDISVRALDRKSTRLN